MYFAKIEILFYSTKFLFIFFTFFLWFIISLKTKKRGCFIFLQPRFCIKYFFNGLLF